MIKKNHMIFALLSVSVNLNDKKLKIVQKKRREKLMNNFF